MSLTSGYPEDLLVKIKCFMPASKTVENHLSWLANRDKISNENKRHKTLSNIYIHHAKEWVLHYLFLITHFSV